MKISKDRQSACFDMPEEHMAAVQKTIDSLEDGGFVWISLCTELPPLLEVDTGGGYNGGGNSFGGFGNGSSSGGGGSSYNNKSSSVGGRGGRGEGRGGGGRGEGRGGGTGGRGRGRDSGGRGDYWSGRGSEGGNKK